MNDEVFFVVALADANNDGLPEFTPDFFTVTAHADDERVKEVMATRLSVAIT